MNILVTGANGSLGRAVVAALVRRGHRVCALVRPAASIAGLGWDPAQVEVCRADLRVNRTLEDAFEGTDVLVHLAAAVGGADDLQFQSTVVGTERLLEAMARSKTKALVLASSYSVYDWSEIGRDLTEDSPIEKDLYARDGYAVAKVWQERVARRMSAEHDWRLTVLRPGFIWGPDSGLISGYGQSVGAWHVVIGPMCQMPLTHVENCAEAFARAAERAATVGGETFNVVDEHRVNRWAFAGHYLRATGTRGRRIPLPYWLALTMVRTIAFVSRRIFGPKGKLPNILKPIAFEARFKPVRTDVSKLRDGLGHTPPLSFEDCLKYTYGSAPDDAQSSPLLRRQETEAA